MNQQNNKPYNVTIIYDDPKKEMEVSVEVSPVSVRASDGKKSLASWQIAVLFGTVLALFGAGGAFSWFFGWKETAVQSESKIILQKNPFESISVEASAAFVFDIQKQKILYAKNEDAQLPLASLTKMMTALIAEETLPSDDILTVGKDAIAEEGDNGLLVDEKWRKENLIALTLLASSNDGARALASAVEAFENSQATSSDAAFSFTDAMNARAEALGMNQTYFLNPAGLDAQKNESGAYGSARDIAALLEYILRTHPDIFDATPYEKMTFMSESGMEHTLKNTNEETYVIPGIVASKTGFTDLAGGNLAVIFEAGPMYPVAVVVLGSSVDGRFADVERLVGATLQKLNQEL